MTNEIDRAKGILGKVTRAGVVATAIGVATLSQGDRSAADQRQIGEPYSHADSLTHKVVVGGLASSGEIASQKSVFTFKLEGRGIFEREAYSKLIADEIKTKEEFERVFRSLKGDEVEIPDFDPTTHNAFYAAVDGVEGPSLKLGEVKESEGKRQIGIVFDSPSVNHEYNPNDLTRQNYIVVTVPRNPGIENSMGVFDIGAKEPFLSYPPQPPATPQQ